MTNNSIIMQGGSQEIYLENVIAIHFIWYFSLRADSEMRHSHTAFGETSSLFLQVFGFSERFS